MQESYQKHQRYILRRFPPFLDDAMIGNNEKLRLLFIVLWSMLIALPTVLAAYTCDYFVKEPLFYFSVLMVLFVFARALIELATAPYKLKILGYYHRKIDHFLGQFPKGTTDAQIHRHYNIRTGVTALLFSAAFVVSTVLILYIFSVASVCVLFYLGKVHCIELPQVIVLRHRPEQDEFAMTQFLFADIQVSCTPSLPPDLHNMHRVVLQGRYFLQIVDASNIAAGHEQRQEDTSNRMLKLCLTDGASLAYAIEYLVAYIIVENVEVRHGLLMLTAVVVLGASGNDALESMGSSTLSTTTPTSSTTHHPEYPASPSISFTHIP
ncbi:hypothetical protein DYB37_004411 [Aphanomyces astaci]|uniref:Uncharacterized protein n=1 Tax=Aphanomyces astaci TaxID=112090 RepID=A0A3R6Y4D8_APHAT|nr:hypothetical protein DYB35_010784 [Aphanomyces astaci]RHZ32505.1 hypothetical protein DYB37_004411 [Aphanomyces astaci]